MCLRAVPSELSKEGSQSCHRSIPHCLMHFSILEKKITALYAALRKLWVAAMVWRKCVSLLLAIQDVPEKKRGHRQFSVSSSLKTPVSNNRPKETVISVIFPILPGNETQQGKVTLSKHIPTSKTILDQFDPL